MFLEAVVTNNNDPKKLGRVKVTCRTLTNYQADFPAWVEPAHQFSCPNPATGESSGSMWVPAQGSVVLVEFLESSSTDQVRLETMVAYAKARYFCAPYSNPAPAPSEFTGDGYPDVRGWKTPSGHVLIFDDRQKTIRIARADGPQYVEMSADGNMVIHASSIKLDEGADVHLVRGEDLKTFINTTLKLYLDTHQHPTAVGPSGPPFTQQPSLPDSALSENHMVL